MCISLSRLDMRVAFMCKLLQRADTHATETRATPPDAGAAEGDEARRPRRTAAPTPGPESGPQHAGLAYVRLLSG